MKICLKWRYIRDLPHFLKIRPRNLTHNRLSQPTATLTIPRFIGNDRNFLRFDADSQLYYEGNPLIASSCKLPKWTYLVWSENSTCDNPITSRELLSSVCLISKFRANPRHFTESGEGAVKRPPFDPILLFSYRRRTA